MSTTELPQGLVGLVTTGSIWDKVFVVAPLVLVGTLEDDGTPNLAPKHMATRIGSDGFCFVCSHRHATLRNALAREAFTVGFPRPSQILQTSLAAGGRAEDSSKPSLAALRTFPATTVEGVLVEGCHLHLECRLDRIVEGFEDETVLVVGRIVAAAAADDALRHSDGDDADLVARSPLLAYVSPGRFASVQETLSFPYPHDFRD
jgi:flavin reductase (DIM6/NTAB) family NADH-FMN oxidoreductase RutF